MTRTIVLTDRGKGWQGNELTGNHKSVINKLATICGKTGSSAIEVDKLSKACRSLKPKRFRAIVRQLVAARVVSVRKAA